MRGIKLACCMSAIAVCAVFFYAGSASADVFCKVDQTPCPAAQHYSAEAPFTAELEGGTEFKLKGIITMSCRSSQVSMAGHEGGLLVWGWTNTSCAPSGCRYATSNIPWKTSMEASGSGNGNMTVSNPKLTFICGLSCTFTATSMSMSFQGGSGGSEAADAKLTLSEAPVTSACGSGKISATYRIESMEGVTHPPVYLIAGT